jgi:hypothetical protein
MSFDVAAEAGLEKASHNENAASRRVYDRGAPPRRLQTTKNVV